MLARFPTQATRTKEQEAFQQFSTPPTLSYLANKVAGITSGDVVLEPSAGNGGLAAFAQAIGAKVHVNEVGVHRREMLKAAGFEEPSNEDGEVIHTRLDRSIQPTVIVMNPPFSAGGLKKGKARNRNQYGFNHVNSALQRLAPGRQANDSEGGASLRGGTSGNWFSRIAQRYNVRANVRVSGKEYGKYGTRFATRLIVIDKDGPTPGRPASWNSVVEKMWIRWKRRIMFLEMSQQTDQPDWTKRPLSDVERRRGYSFETYWEVLGHPNRQPRTPEEQAVVSHLKMVQKATDEAVARRDREWERAKASYPLSPEARKAIGKQSPELVWGNVQSKVVLAVEHPEADQVADDQGWDRVEYHLDDLHYRFLSGMVPTKALNILVERNPKLDLSEELGVEHIEEPLRDKARSLELLNAVLEMMMYDERYANLGII